jgi:hypothetical protein
MKRNPRYALLFALFAVGSLLALGYAPAASTQIERIQIQGKRSTESSQGSE